MRSWLSLLVASAELFRGEVAEALSVKIARLETEDQQAVVTELRTHEQGLLGVDDYGTNPTHEPTENRCCRYGDPRRTQSG